MAIQTGPQEICHEVGGGKKKNCGNWAEWESGNVGTAVMCNGGWTDGLYFETCPVRAECKSATDRKKHLPIFQQNQRPNGGTAVLASSLGSPMRLSPDRPVAQQTDYDRNFQRNHEAYLASLQATRGQAQATGGMIRRPAGAPQLAQTQQYQGTIPQGSPFPVQPPQTFPHHMQTPYAAPQPTMGSQTPTWLPQQDENPFGRLGKNIAQGMAGSLGWHVFDYFRNVDVFRR